MIRKEKKITLEELNDFTKLHDYPMNSLTVNAILNHSVVEKLSQAHKGKSLTQLLNSLGGDDSTKKDI